MSAPITAAVSREYYAIRYTHASFGSRPDQTHPDMVRHELSEGRYVIDECANMQDAYRCAHRAIADGVARGHVDVLRIAEHAPVEIIPSPEDIFGVPVIKTCTITGCVNVDGIPHFAAGPLTRYHPVSGTSIPDTIIVD